ncbi:Uncharacterised protein [Streptococcus pneumoniae]|nr:Uncharacterised protein [Streptococcus pneumoniae]
MESRNVSTKFGRDFNFLFLLTLQDYIHCYHYRKKKNSLNKESLFSVTYFPLQFVGHFQDVGERSKRRQYVFFDQYII